MTTAKTATAAILSILIVALLSSLFLRVAFQEPVEFEEGASPGSVLWDTRDFETILQGLIILGGVFAILMLLRYAKKEESK